MSSKPNITMLHPGYGNTAKPFIQIPDHIPAAEAVVINKKRLPLLRAMKPNMLADDTELQIGDTVFGSFRDGVEECFFCGINPKYPGRVLLSPKEGEGDPNDRHQILGLFLASLCACHRTREAAEAARS